MEKIILTRYPAPRKQQGVALFIALVLLLIAAMMGISGMQSAVIQEKMTTNLYDRSLAMQSAEAAMRAAQELIQDAIASNTSPPNMVDCTTTDCPAVPANTFESNSTEGWNDVISGSFLVNDSLKPGTAQYHIQYLGVVNSDDKYGQNRTANCDQYGANCLGSTRPVYRITARSGTPTDSNNRSLVVLSALN